MKLLRVIRSFCRSLAQWGRAVWAGRRVSGSQYRRRIETCGGCPAFTASTQICGECWCWMPIKAKLAGVSCPLEKW